MLTCQRGRHLASVAPFIPGMVVDDAIPRIRRRLHAVQRACTGDTPKRRQHGSSCLA